MDNNKDNILLEDGMLNPENEKQVKSPLTKQEKEKRIITIINRIVVFVFISVVLFGCAGLGVEYVLVKGPSPALRDTFVHTMLETRRFGFIPSLFLSDEEINEIRSKKTELVIEDTDTSLINIPNEGEAETENELPDYGLVDEDGDGIILEEVSRKGFSGYMAIVLDPSRVFVGMPEQYGGSGLTVGEMCERYDAIGGINAGGFLDTAGAGIGGYPAGLTVIDGKVYNSSSPKDCFVGFDSDNILHIGYFTAKDIEEKNIRDGVTFSPILVNNGTMADFSHLVSGINPRTAIGQRADGAVLLLVIDGRQAHSIGATYADIAEVMLDYGAVNACNLDGGSSTVMWYEGDYINLPSANPRQLPTGFLFK